MVVKIKVIPYVEVLIYTSFLGNCWFDVVMQMLMDERPKYIMLFVL